TPTAESSPLSLHDALPISAAAVHPARATLARSGPNSTSGRSYLTPRIGFHRRVRRGLRGERPTRQKASADTPRDASLARSVAPRSEEHTSELQSRENLVCR